jgi:hypothetical protein
VGVKICWGSTNLWLKLLVWWVNNFRGSKILRCTNIGGQQFLKVKRLGSPIFSGSNSFRCQNFRGFKKFQCAQHFQISKIVGVQNLFRVQNCSWVKHFWINNFQVSKFVVVQEILGVNIFTVKQIDKKQENNSPLN